MKEKEDTALITAVRDKDIVECRRLLSAGVNPDEAGKSGLTALIWALFMTHWDIAEVLLDAKADVNAVSDDGTTALMTAGEDGMVRALIDAKAKINAANCHGRTALMQAALHNHAEKVKMLISAGADMNMIDDSGRTALGIAKDELSGNVIPILEAMGAK